MKTNLDRSKELNEKLWKLIECGYRPAIIFDTITGDSGKSHVLVETPDLRVSLDPPGYVVIDESGEILARYKPEEVVWVHENPDALEALAELTAMKREAAADFSSATMINAAGLTSTMAATLSEIKACYLIMTIDTITMSVESVKASSLPLEYIRHNGQQRPNTMMSEVHAIYEETYELAHASMLEFYRTKMGPLAERFPLSSLKQATEAKEHDE